jgi:membrane protein
MQHSKSLLFVAPLQKPSRYSIFKRIANLILIVTGVIICINLWLVRSEQSSNWHNKQANQLGNSLSSLSGNILNSSLKSKNAKELSQQLSYIIADPHVSAASLYDNKGRLVTNNNDFSSVVAAHQLNSIDPLVFVQNITFDGQTIGYLSIMLKEQEVMKYHSEYQKQLDQQLQVLMLLAAAAGMLLTRAFYKIRYRQLLKGEK